MKLFEARLFLVLLFIVFNPALLNLGETLVPIFLKILLLLLASMLFFLGVLLLKSLKSKSLLYISFKLTTK